MPESRAEDGLGYGPNVTVLRANDRFVTRAGAITTWHCFSFGSHYDPDRTGIGALRAVNEERLGPGTGYGTHRHADTEIVTWILDGVLAHEDSAGNRGLVRPGEVQHVSAGSGLEHTERNASDTEPARFVQMMLAPSYEALRADPLPPTYRQHEVARSRGQLVPVLTVRPGVELYAGFLDPYDAPYGAVALPTGGDAHLHVTRGTVDLEGVGRLGAGDTAQVVGSGGLPVRGRQPAEVLVWRLAGAPQ